MDVQNTINSTSGHLVTTEALIIVIKRVSVYFLRKVGLQLLESPESAVDTALSIVVN